MRRLFSTVIDERYLNIAILILRICIACFMLTHGLKKWDKFFSDEPIKYADPIGIGVIASLALSVFSEVFCSLLLFFGLFTRFAVIPLFITMAVAVLIVHAGEPFGKMEDALLYLVIYFVLLVTGGGKYSLDRLLENRMNSRR